MSTQARKLWPNEAFDYAPPKSGLIDPRATAAAAIRLGLLTPAPSPSVSTETLLRRKRGYRNTSHRAPTSPPEPTTNGPQGAVRQAGCNMPHPIAIPAQAPLDRALSEAQAHQPLKHGELARIAAYHGANYRSLLKRVRGQTKKSYAIS